jgi:hypothetical protein
MPTAPTSIRRSVRQEFGRQQPRPRAVAAAAITQRLGTELVVAARQLLKPARHEAGVGRRRRHRLPLGQKPDRLVVPCRAGIRAGAGTPTQFLDAQMIGDVGHVRLREKAHTLTPRRASGNPPRVDQPETVSDF